MQPFMSILRSLKLNELDTKAAPFYVICIKRQNNQIMSTICKSLTLKQVHFVVNLCLTRWVLRPDCNHQIYCPIFQTKFASRVTYNNAFAYLIPVGGGQAAIY